MNNNLLTIIERIKKLKGVDHDKDVAQLLNMTKQNLSGFIKRNALPKKQLSLFAHKENISIDWLLTGQHSQTSMEYNTTTQHDPGRIKIDVQSVIDAVLEVMNSDDEETKLALAQNAYTFQRTVRNGKEIAELKKDIDIIKRRFFADVREDDFKIQEEQRVKHRVGAKHEGGRD